MERKNMDRMYRSSRVEFEEMHIDIVWSELRQRFGFNLEGWKNDYKAFLLRQSRTTSNCDAFLKFGNDAINPVLNTILKRPYASPTFNRMVQYVVKRGR